MTKLSIWFSKTAGFLAIVLACASCASEDLFEADYSLGRQNISLEVVTSDNQTRTPGDDNLNENRFVSLDYYFFAENNDGQTLKLHKSEGTRLSEGNSTLDISLHTYTGSLSDADLQALFGANAADGSQCYVYVLANLDATTRAAVNAKTTLGDIKRVSFQDENIKFNGKQDCFVMFGGGQVSLTTDATTGVRTLGGNPIMMTRDAAKIVLTVTSVQEELEVKDINDQVTAKWKSLPEQMHVMFYNGVNKSYVHSLINTGSHYVPSSEDDCYFDLTAANTEWRQLTAGNSNAPYTNLTHQYPIYSYLADWRENEDDASYMILVLPWQEVDPNNNDAPIGAPRPTYYQIETSPTNTYYENYFYHISIKVGILGSFELPEPVELQSTYMIVPWENQDVDSKLSEPSYLIVETNQYTMNNVNTASIPYVTSHEIDFACVKEISYVNTYNNGTNSFATRPWRNYTGNYNGTLTDRDGSVTMNTYVSNEKFDVSFADGMLTLSHTISSSQYTRYDVTVVIRNKANPYLEEEVVFTIYPAIFIDVIEGDNAFVNGRFGHVEAALHANNGNWRMSSSTANGNNYNNHNANTYQRSNSYINGNYVRTGYGSLMTSNFSGFLQMLRVKISSFNSTDEHFTIDNVSYTYKITDPRVKSNLNDGINTNANPELNDYWVTEGSYYYVSNNTSDENVYNNKQRGVWSSLSPIMEGSSSKDAIAPDFLISSVYGRTQGQNAQDFETFRRRCATYQEAGYPAGRWRLPTEAELNYVCTLQGLGIIPELFKSSSTYWASSGRAARYNNNTNKVDWSTPGTAGVRCVYDLWYWGDDPKDTRKFWAMPSKE